MKRFLISVFLIAITSCFVITMVAIPEEYKIRQVPNPYRYKYEWMQKNADDVEILVFGSSHTFFGIRPEFFENKAFSLANSSQGLRHDLYLFEYWADKYKKLKTVIFPISYFSWFDRGLEYGSESYRCRYYKIYMDCNLYSDISLYNLELSDVKTAKIKKWKYEVHDNDCGCDAYGWGTAYKLSGKNMEIWNDGTEAEAAVKRHTVKGWDYIDQNYAYLKDIAEFCKYRQIQLVLITTPCWHTYYDNLNNKQLSKMYSLTHIFVNQYKLLYLDYLKDKRFIAEDFFDSNHLSDVGAIKFTKILDNDIKIER